MKIRSKEAIQSLFLLIVAGIILVLGWKLFLFMTDDAYISFRYIENHMRGYGYVWNKPPFMPVEGYTNFLWIVLLEGVWNVFNIAPPIAANYVSLIFSYLTICLAVLMTVRLKWSKMLNPYRIIYAGLLLLFLLSNRTFLAWTSSGLETALFTFLVTLWVYIVVYTNRKTFLWYLGVSTVVSLIALTRPDGLLFWAATIYMVAASLMDPRLKGVEYRVLSSMPLLVVPLHVLWRHAFYGEWLPNTYYAKCIGMWPESGFRYLASFILEYALFVWIIVLIVGVAVYFQKTREIGFGKRVRKAMRLMINPVAVVVGVFVVQATYYVVTVGGDHFEYRVFNHFLLFIFLSFLWVLNKISIKPQRVAVLAMVFIVLSLPVPWTHFALTHDMQNNKETIRLKKAIADYWPAPFTGYAKVFDRLQFWLIDHSVCMRHQGHKVFLEHVKKLWPEKKQAIAIQGNLKHQKNPMIFLVCVGYPSWVFSDINIIDTAGLNNAIVSRMPVMDKAHWQMAHSKQHLIHFYYDFNPSLVNFHFIRKLELSYRHKIDSANLRLVWTARDGGGLNYIYERINHQPLTDDQVKKREQLWMSKVKSGEFPKFIDLK